VGAGEGGEPLVGRDQPDFDAQAIGMAAQADYVEGGGEEVGRGGQDEQDAGSACPVELVADAGEVVVGRES
jgi:hypothetical protein